MTVKNPLSLDEHKALGAELAAIRSRLQTIGGALANRFGVSSRIGKRAVRMTVVLNDLRYDLDSVASEAYSDLPNETIQAMYFPSGDRDTGVFWDTREGKAGVRGVVVVRWVSDEVVEIEVDGTVVVTVNHDEHGWAGMEAAITVAKQLAGRLGGELRVEGTPNLDV